MHLQLTDEKELIRILNKTKSRDTETTVSAEHKHGIE